MKVRQPRFLIIRRDNIGDLVCTTPLLAMLRKAQPDADIAVLASLSESLPNFLIEAQAHGLAVVAGLKDPTANQRLRELGAWVRPSTPVEFTAALKADEASVAELIQKGLLKPE